MTEPSWAAGTRLRLARQARGLSQQQLAGMAAVTRQAVSAVESGHSDPSLRVALALGRALGMTVEELFGPGDPADPVLAQPVAPVGGEGSRVALATVGDTFVALPLGADTLARAGFGPAGGLVVGRESHGDLIAVRPIAPPRPTLVVAGCDPALPLLETPLALLDPPLGFTWWPCGNGEALRLAAAGLVHAAGVHQGGDEAELPDGAELVAEDRSFGPGSSPVLFDLLDAMDGAAADADLLFVLTTNRADLLEPALAARPGRVDVAIEIDLPDADARKRLLALYSRSIPLQLSEADWLEIVEAN